MKRSLASLLLAIGVSTPFLSIPLAAEPNAQTAHIPFAFQVNGRSLPAGDYSVSPLSRPGLIFSVRSDNGSTFVQMGIPQDRRTDESSLTFACLGRDCVLIGITPSFGSATYTLSPSQVEKHWSHKLSMASMISVRLGAR